AIEGSEKEEFSDVWHIPDINRIAHRFACSLYLQTDIAHFFASAQNSFFIFVLVIVLSSAIFILVITCGKSNHTFIIFYSKTNGDNT
ncbi:MAG: hypothetical protein IJY89_00245, partial [Clostridia bacterium]|nr:hypothetical protein [Clostridia bacterium]